LRFHWGVPLDLLLSNVLITKEISMRKTLTFTLLLLLSAACLLAQDNMGGSAGPKTIQGCLSNSSGQYWLTESNGTKHQLSSHANVLKNHIGHEVAITGTDAVKTVSTTQQGAASTAHQIPIFRVQTVKHIADTCSAQ
jgi:hypothetical protein